jgi:hypothetical protein
VGQSAGLKSDVADYVRTYYLTMDITLSVDDEIIQRARGRAETLGTSVDQLIRDYLEQLAGKTDPKQDAEEFEKLSRLARGHSGGWKFNREELHERK